MSGGNGRALALAVVVTPACSSLDGVVVCVHGGELVGSGVVVAPGRALTAAHLVSSPPGGAHVMRQVSAAACVVSGFRVLEVRGDVALLLCAEGMSDGVLPVGGSPSQGAVVEVVDALAWPAARVPCVAVSGDVLRPVGRYARVGPGLSGAPVVDKDGRLAGIVTGVLSADDEPQLVVIVPAGELGWVKEMTR